MSHLDVSLVNILLSITRVSLVQNKCVFCQLRVHYNIILKMCRSWNKNIDMFIPQWRGTPCPCLKLRCAGGREFDPRPWQYQIEVLKILNGYENIDSNLFFFRN